MSVIALDTLKVAKTLKAAGFSEEQAEAVAQVVRDSQNVDFSTLATKTELADVKADVAALKTDVAGLKNDMASLRAEIKSEIAKVRTEMAEIKVEIIKWVIGIGFAQTGFLLAMLRFMR